MLVKIDELWVGNRCFEVTATVVGNKWDRGDRGVGYPPGFEDFAVESVTAYETFFSDMPVEVTDKEFLETLRKGAIEYFDRNGSISERIMEDLAEDYIRNEG